MKSVFKLFIMCSLVLSFAMPIFADEITDDLLDIARTYYNKGNKSKTLEYVEQVLQIDENNLSAIELKIKLQPPKVSKPENKFTDEYLKFYTDIKVPSRKYDW